MAGSRCVCENLHNELYNFPHLHFALNCVFIAPRVVPVFLEVLNMVELRRFFYPNCLFPCARASLSWSRSYWIVFRSFLTSFGAFVNSFAFFQFSFLHRKISISAQGMLHPSVAEKKVFFFQRWFFCAKRGGASTNMVLGVFGTSPDQIGSGEHAVLDLGIAFCGI